jgi:hypothetical protein
MHEDDAIAVDQPLTVADMMTTTYRKVPDPPEVLLVLDVIHDDTKHEWRQAVRFNRTRFEQLIRLLHYTAQEEGIPWPTE